MTVIRRQRIMSVAGKVIVRAGQKVSAADTVAEANLLPEYLLLDISRGLGLPVDQTDRHIHCRIGDQLAEKDIVAGPIGLTRRIVRTPRSGKVVIAGDGQVLMEINGQPFQMKAGLPGEIIELIPERGVVIESAGALLQGVWGNGRIDSGQLWVLAKTPDHEIEISDLDVSSRGWVVLAGYCNDPEVLKAIDELALHGLILGSMDARLIPIAIKSSVPIILLEGFGQRQIGALSYKLLVSMERREVALNAEHRIGLAGVKPEIFFPAAVPSTVNPTPDFITFDVNQHVRLVRAPHAGKTGVVEEIRGITAFPGGLNTRAALVHLEDGENAIIPIANLEALA